MKFLKILLFVIGLLLTVGSLKVNAQLQEMVITEVTAAPEDAVVLLDHPGKVILSFRSGIPNMNFSSSFQILDERTPVPGEYLVIVEPENQIITVSAPGYLAERIPLRALQPSQRFHYIVEPKAQAMDETIPMVLQTQPAGATVEIDGETVDITRSVPLTPGTHLVRISRDGYRTIEQEIEADRENTFITFSLEQVERVPVTIRTVPANATVSFNGITVGQSGDDGIFQQFRFPGNYNVTVSSLNFINEQRSIEVTDLSGANNEFLFELQPSSTTLTLSIEPSDARVLIDNREQDHTEPIKLSEGVYRLQIDKEGYQPYEESIRLSANENRELNIELEQLTGRFFFTVSPSSASAELLNNNGDIAASWSGIHRAVLPVGEYQLIVKAEGYREVSESIVISHNGSIEKRINLQQLLEPELITSDDETTDDPVPEPIAEENSGDSQLESRIITNQPSKGKAITASILFPGAGHIYTKQSRGYLYLIAGVATAGLAAYSFADGKSLADSYDTAFDNYRNARNFSDTATYRNEAKQLFEERESATSRLNISLIAFSAIHAIQLIDILTTQPAQGFQNESQEGFQANITPTGIRLKYGFN